MILSSIWGGVQNFLETYSDNYGREQRCYRLLSFQQSIKINNLQKQEFLVAQFERLKFNLPKTREIEIHSPENSGEYKDPAAIHAPEFSGTQKIHSPEFSGVYKDQQLIDMSKFAHIYLVAKTPKTAYNSHIHGE